MKVSLPKQPFTTEAFFNKGGGIDFLGLRWVNLTILGQHLIPQLNNVTQDMGTYFLAAWIPWKFRELCSSQRDYTERNYKAFREKIEVAIALTYREPEDLHPFGPVRNRVGNDQDCQLPAVLNFESVQRTNSNSLYAAAIYGPSIQYLGFIDSYRSQAVAGQPSLNIPVVSQNPEIQKVIRAVDHSLRQTDRYSQLASLSPYNATVDDIRDLSTAGLDPAQFRSPDYLEAKKVFAKHLLPKDPNTQGYARTLTAMLVLDTLSQSPGLKTSEFRNIWYTGKLPNRSQLVDLDSEVELHRIRWSHFMARQYQRYAIELFLWCFEIALKDGCHSIPEIVDYWLKRSGKMRSIKDQPFRQVLEETAGDCLADQNLFTSQNWNQRIHQNHENFEFIENPQDDDAVFHGLKMMAGWYWRMLSRREEGRVKEFLTLGGSDRMSISWFIDWLEARANWKTTDFIADLFSDLIFAQHLRVALSRFDGKAQRLRFLLEDNGIEPTISARDKIGQTGMPWMPDRLDALTNLMIDSDILTSDVGKLFSGRLASIVAVKNK